MLQELCNTECIWTDEDSEEEEEEDDDDEDEDEEEEDDDEEEGDSQLGASQESDSDGEDLPTCPICLDKLRRQDIGSPESCDHQFCMECIVEWSKVKLLVQLLSSSKENKKSEMRMTASILKQAPNT